MDDSRVGSALNAVRLRKAGARLTFAHRAGVSLTTVSDIELGRNGATTIETLRRIARALDVRIDVVARWRGGELDRLLNSRQ